MNTAKQYQDVEPLTIHELVNRAAQCLAPVWPIETFIACNPLQGFEHQSFEDALIQSERIKQYQPMAGLEAVNHQMIKWCAAFFDAGQASIDMPYRQEGFYAAFLKLALFDKTLHQHQKKSKEFLKQLPKRSEQAILVCLRVLNVTEGQEQAFLSDTFLYLPGWAGFAKWKADWQPLEKTAQDQLILMDFLAVRLVLTVLLWPLAAQEQHAAEDCFSIKKTLDQLKRREERYQDQLLSLLIPSIQKKTEHLARRKAQLVFCIDVRSEPFRRAIESLGEYETFGFAGFFGLPVQAHEFDSPRKKESCPVLLKPKFVIEETAVIKNKSDFDRYQRGKMLLNDSKKMYMQLKHNVSTPFALVESIGLWYGLSMVLKALSPVWSQRVITTMKEILKPTLPTKVTYESDTMGHGLSLEAQIQHAEGVLRLMGLVSDFAKVVILCGHGSTTYNNPYAASLDCGACGGNHGGINARLLASILNNTAVRSGLESVGIHIPLDTIFYGALHNTTTDDVELYTDEVQGLIYPELLNQLKRDLVDAKKITNHERALKLKVKDGIKEIERRSVDWSETRPEWGLAKNAAFIVGPRDLTKDFSLDGRCFLHSYRYDQDESGVLLETILTAPMVVAQWINSQYLFSTLDNVSFGSGSKVTQNVVGKIGIMQGNGSDLMHGLSLQSVMSSDKEGYHEPQRLLTVVYARKETVYQVIEKHSILKTLFFNEWVHLIVIDPIDRCTYRYRKGVFDVLSA